MPHLPPSLRVFERGWLSANNILCKDVDEGLARYTLIDSGYVSHAGQTVDLVRQAVHGAPLVRVINTHLHSDHCGGNAALHATFNCRIAIPAADAAAVACWDEAALSFRASGQDCARFMYDELIAPGDTLELGGQTWQVLGAPGHDPHALLLFAPGPRILISGDALWQHGFGALFPELCGDSGFAEQHAVLELIADLDAAAVIPGHGPVFVDVEDAIARARSRLAYLQADPRRNALHAARVLIKFRLLQQRCMTDLALLQWMEGALYFEQIRSRFLDGVPMSEVMAESIAGLIKAGAARRADGVLYDLS